MIPALLGFAGLVGAIIAGVAVSQQFSATARLRRGVRREPRTMIVSIVARGPGKIDGRVIARGETLVSPLSGTRCVCYCVTLYRGSERYARVPFADVVRSVLFTIEDESGSAVVDASEAELHLGTKISRFGHQLPAGFARDHGQKDDLDVSKELFLEHVIVHGQALTVVGVGIEEPDPDGVPDDPMRGAAPARIRIVAPAGGKLRIIDDAS